MDDDTLPRATNKGMTDIDIDDNDDSAAMAAGVDVILFGEKKRNERAKTLWKPTNTLGWAVSHLQEREIRGSLVVHSSFLPHSFHLVLVDGFGLSGEFHLSLSMTLYAGDPSLSLRTVCGSPTPKVS